MDPDRVRQIDCAGPTTGVERSTGAGGRGEELADAAMPRYDGIQHGSFLDGIECVDEPVLKYLIEPTPPEEELRCPMR